MDTYRRLAGAYQELPPDSSSSHNLANKRQPESLPHSHHQNWQAHDAGLYHWDDEILSLPDA